MGYLFLFLVNNKFQKNNDDLGTTEKKLENFQLKQIYLETVIYRFFGFYIRFGNL